MQVDVEDFEELKTLSVFCLEFLWVFDWFLIKVKEVGSFVERPVGG